MGHCSRCHSPGSAEWGGVTGGGGGGGGGRCLILVPFEAISVYRLVKASMLGSPSRDLT